MDPPLPLLLHSHQAAVKEIVAFLGLVHPLGLAPAAVLVLALLLLGQESIAVAS